jgi:CubicO group peptidase (beta-lactamase class C family)
MTRRIVAFALSASLLALVACSGDDDTGAPSGTEDSVVDAEPTTGEVDPTFPGAAWATVDPVEAGFDPAALDALSAEAEAADSGCLAVVRDGELVLDEGWGPGQPGDPRQAFSATKSITSVLTGIAQDEGDLSIEQPAADFIPEWADTPAGAVTVEDLLSNDSGREWSLALDYRDMAVQAPDKTQFAIDLEQTSQPGEVWAYNNSAIQTLSAVLEEATGQPATDLAAEQLLEPIGMADSTMTTDASGGALTFMGLQTTCQDLARFGLLMLHDGSWGGEQVVSAEYVQQATGEPSTDLVDNYGLLFWLNRTGRMASPTIATAATAATGATTETETETDTQMVPEAPDDVFWALGFQEQIVAVIPSEGIVAVRMGTTPPADAPFTYAELTGGVLGALA